MESTPLINATDISKHIGDFPHIKNYLDNLVKDLTIEIRDVGLQFNYPWSVVRNKEYSCHGCVINYFIRKHLSNKYDMEIEDRRALAILNEEKYDNISVDIKNCIRRHYKIFTDKNTRAIDIVESVKVVSYSHGLFFREKIPRRGVEVNRDNLIEIMHYLDQLSYKEVLLNPKLGNELFNADANLIFDNDVILAIRTCKHRYLVFNEEEVPKSKFYQLILYSFGFYKNTNNKILKLIIYNPLLGLEYRLTLNNIDYKAFEDVLKIDIDKFYKKFGIVKGEKQENNEENEEEGKDKINEEEGKDKENEEEGKDKENEEEENQKQNKNQQENQDVKEKI